jgi:hypothetical protein
MSSGNVPGAGEGWRAVRASWRPAAPSVPQWLATARAQAKQRGFAPSAEQIATLAREIRTLDINITRGGETFSAAGLIPELGAISRSQAFEMLLRLAEAGRQAQPVTISFEDILRLKEFDGAVLLDVAAARGIAADLDRANIRVTVGVGPETDTTLDQADITGLYGHRVELGSRLGNESLTGVLRFWREQTQDFPRGTYPLPGILDFAL